jgi:signal transduction histidine kinase
VEPGVGLGLYVVRGLVEQLGGTISVKSEVDSGSTFTICLPKWLNDEAQRLAEEHKGVEAVVDSR